MAMGANIVLVEQPETSLKTNSRPQVFDKNPTKKKYGHIFDLPEGVKWNDCVYSYGFLYTAKYIPWELADKWIQLYHNERAKEWEVNSPYHVPQRSLKDTNISHLRHEIREGHFQRIGDTVRFSCAPIALMDARHRLECMVAEEEGFMMDIIIGLEHEQFDLIDQGAARTAFDVLDGLDVKNAKAVSGAIRMALNYEFGNFSSLGRSRGRVISNRDVKEYFYGNRDIEELASVASNVYSRQFKENRLVTPRIQAGLTWIYLLEGHKESLLSNFFNRLYDGLDIHDRDDPIYVLRSVLRQHKSKSNLFRLDSEVVIYYIIEAMNYWLQVKGVKPKHFDSVVKFPGIISRSKVKRKPRKE